MSLIKFDIRFSLLSKSESIKDISYKKLNDIKTAGIYDGFNIEDAPDENYIQVIVTKHSETWIVQECKTYLDNLLLRSFKNGIWSKWTEITPSPDDDNSDKEYIVIDRPHSHQNASSSNVGFMSKTDKSNLDFIVSYLKDNGLDLGGDAPPLYETIEGLKADVETLSSTKAEVNHNHDKAYVPRISNEAPLDHDVTGQVWIQVEK